MEISQGGAIWIVKWEAGVAAPISQKDYKSIRLIVLQSPDLLLEISNAFKEGQRPLYGVPTVIMVSSKPSAVEHIE